MVRSKSLVAVIAFGAAVSACNGGGQRVEAVPNRLLDSVNQPVVERSDFVFDVSGGDAGLAASEKERLREWFKTVGLGYGDRVFVDEPNPTRSRADIARVTAEFGLLLSEGAPVTAGSVRPGSSRVVVSRSTAHVPGCPNWSPTATSATGSNYGCAINSNLAAMIADPADLVLGQSGSGTGDATATAKAIKVYRDKAPSGTGALKSESSKGGN
ncbi:pilus assembly protein CpaD [Sphingomonas parva]|uniref:Pilus assembly protein CpaD n=1 Tax=Sphingomonas parva TaxID=2555898 RepID=A0A4Y8ZPH3_9SPHN|nr:CpaD family pilus assembly lipoprotein [Sphingomonas parva]TFI57864.1 pilus assembly protein CpaD [Sphingomonas parva]